MKYKLIKTTVNIKTHTIIQTINICNNEKELDDYWKNIPSSDIFKSSISNKIDDAEYSIYSGEIVSTDYIITIIQYSLNYLP